MFTVAKMTLNCRRQILKLNDFKSDLLNVCSRSYNGRNALWSLETKYFVIINSHSHKLRQYSSDSTTSPPAPTNPKSSTTTKQNETTTIRFTPPPPPKTKPDKKPTLYERIKPAHWHKDEDQDPGVTEHMLVEAAQSKHGVAMTFQEKMREDTKTAWYAGVMAIGFMITATLLYTVWEELFSRDSPQNVYSHAHKLCNANVELQDTLGTPIRCHGEETRRGWRRHILHQEFWENGVLVMRMKFYLKGRFRNATVNLQKRANEKGKFTKYDYLVVDCDGYPPKRVVIDVESV